MENEGVNIGSKVRDQEWHSVDHQAADEVDISSEAVQLGDRYDSPILISE